MQGLSSRDDDNGKGSSSSSSSSSSSNRSGGIVKGGFNVENTITLAVLFGLSSVYLYLLTSPDQPTPSVKPRPFVIPSDTRERFEEFLKSYHTENSYEGYDMKSLQESFNDAWTSESLEKDWGSKGNKDDFFYEGREESEGEGNKGTKYEPNVASTNFRCEEGWVTIRSDTNYKYLWMHSGTDYWMSATATMDTPLHRRAFHTEPVNSDCSEGGWVLMKEGDTHGYLMMVPPVPEGDPVPDDEWVIKVSTDNKGEAISDHRYHFLLEEEGYLLNKGAMAFVNVFSQSEYTARGHTANWNRDKPSGREYGAMVRFQSVNDTDVMQSIKHEEDELKEDAENDIKYIDYISKLPTSIEKRYISFGLYGNNLKYTGGAIENAKLSKVYFPGWTCRYYVTSDVSAEVKNELISQGAEIVDIPSGEGLAAGMFHRFLVAVDNSVDRYIIRDVDSRLNARDRIAVEDWIKSKEKVHIIRDHVNHCFVPMNGGMWGGVKGAIPHMKERLDAWWNKDEYAADLHFLEDQVWPDIQHAHIAHDSYCCNRYPNTKPFPTKRPATYQHVGQVFDAEGAPRLSDIDGFIRGVPIPSSCRKKPEWIYG